MITPDVMLGVLDMFEWFKKKKKVTKRELPEVSKTPPMPEVKAPVKSEKQIATEAGEPYVAILRMDVDPNNLHRRI
jgi:CRISPR/Cas system-associated protein Cas10 (large subunit of type III CRISPR-Cas system)